MKSFYQQSESIKSHYKKVSKSYNNSWEYSHDFVQFLSEKIVLDLELKPTDTLVDIGCGTGFFTKKICDLVSMIDPTICVDPSKEMIEKIPLQKEFKPLVMYARDFVKQQEYYNKVLMKHMLHIVKNKSQLIKSLFERLPPNGILLLVMMPPTTEHPLFEAAIERYEQLQHHYEDIACLFKKVGFKTTVKFIDYPVSIEKTKYFQMIENYYLTLLSSFTNREIQEGINELKLKYHSLTYLNFRERYIFLKGQKPSKK
ncbi:MAG: methyltransferase domain-containing protein [Prochloraceae cyanobacterium]